MKNLIILLSLGIFMLLLQSCNKDSETVPESILSGKWELTSTSGGFSGGGYTPNFEFLEIDPVLNFVALCCDQMNTSFIKVD